ncbi:transcriptional regulator YeiL [Desulfitobacterium chlororespirans]|uniref:cAMP-binding domain of CRP or a regulatory subunit of cAMP-dependent protein kinases n=1 Tax=Desulfitobacterium chlororespirans DSM 11544 TaxID=1121395 RepID=A0A1M7UZ70_9FIRM|nr:transcriptional regulator YeiL [Desulfitobacterium chlororespirans]SHN88216.1 cAMP-binding domain of CRP or a regulatory subunit of cAMP-dependent protein kinases [Desulfitobacterium chlororespirans DSM 11544]
MKRFYPKSEHDPYYQVMKSLAHLPLGKLLTHAHIEVFERGEYLSRCNEPIHTLYYLISGKAKIYMIHDDGKQSILQFLSKDNYVGELSLLGVEDVPKDVVALQQCVCLASPLEQFKPLMLSDAAFLHHLCVYLGQKVLTRSERFSENLNYPLKNRLAAFILFTAHDRIYGEKHVETAEYLGVSYRHLLYTIQQFKEEGILIKQKGAYFIADPQALQVLAKDIRA